MQKNAGDHHITVNPETQTTRTTDLAGIMEPLRPQVPSLVILCHPDPRRVGETAPLPELLSGREARISRLEPSFAGPGEDASFRPLEEAHLSRHPLRIVPGEPAGTMSVVRSGSRTRTIIDGLDLEERRELSAAAVERGVVLMLGSRVTLLLQLMDPLPSPGPHFGLVGESDAIVRLRQEVKAAARLNVPVLLRGESGTGKELVARALHEGSSRKTGPYVAINMGALPPSLAASELFGAARGAYTGADRKKPGLFRSAHGGTLFLDEIGEAPLEVQVLLLRVLEDREVQAVGSVERHSVDVRVIAATDANLESAVSEGNFRAPLLHRLGGYEISLPGLRERRDDIARLLYHFLRLEFENLGQPGQLEHMEEPPWPPAELVAKLVGHSWPGNVRQLRNVARRLAMARGTSSPEGLGALVERILHGPSPSSAPPQEPSSHPSPVAPSLPSSVAPSLPSSVAPSLPSSVAPSQRPRFRKPSEVGKEELRSALTEHRWQLKPTALALGVSRATLYRLIEQDPTIRKATELTREEIEETIATCGGDLDSTAASLEVSIQGLKRRMTGLGLSG